MSNVIVNQQELDREIAEIDERLKEMKALEMRKAELLSFKQLAQRLFGPPNGTSNRSETISFTTGGLILSILQAEGGKTIAQLLSAARLRGYQGSGDDAKDKKRLLAAIYGLRDKFEKDGDLWKVKTSSA
jgi:hypothetical protein